MGKYTCEKCGKEFNQKSHYTTHLNKKNPCVVESKIKEMIDTAVKEKLVEIKKLKPIEFEIIDEDDIIYDNKLVKHINHKKITIPKPILKWVGGKTQILDKLIIEFPTNINNYHEIFLGGGSVLLTLLSYIKNGIIKLHGNIYAYDLNEPLIYIYKNIQSNHDELYNEIQKIITEFNSCGDGEINRAPKNIDEAKMAKENYYYWIRCEYNKLNFNDKKTILGSAMFIFLNKTCFRGVFRVGPKGFNVPYGHYNNPEIINNLEEIHTLIQPVIFQCADFKTSIIDIQTVSDSNDFMYLDPPYAPENSTSFVSYNKAGFTIKNNIDLFELIKSLNFRFMMSNADVTFVREHFTDYHIKSILCRRAINSKNPASKSNEVIISNY